MLIFISCAYKFRAMYHYGLLHTILEAPLLQDYEQFSLLFYMC